MRFGTDGVRGVANTALTPEFALALGRAVARVLNPGQVVVGMDTRISGPLLESAFAAGLACEGVDVLRLGVVATPAVAFVAETLGAAGAMISASHNPFADNGIKVFGVGGRKLADDVESAIEAQLVDLGAPTLSGSHVGRIMSATQYIDGYETHVTDSLAGRRLDGLRIVVDAAHGSASPSAGRILRKLGAVVTEVGCSPDGININDHCGATHPAHLSAVVIELGAELGLALDGDADRLIAVDENGATVDGDHIMAILARDMHERGTLRHDTVVVTVMTNLGFRQAMGAIGIAVIDTPVGDRYVLDALDAGGFCIGGEQSGHVILRDLASTGDGLLVGLALCDVVRRSGRSLADLAASSMTQLPQLLVNVRLAEKDPTILDRLAPTIRMVEAELGANGRVLVRTSGTEPLLRVMVEAPTANDANDAVLRIIDALGSPKLQ